MFDATGNENPPTPSARQLPMFFFDHFRGGSAAGQQCPMHCWRKCLAGAFAGKVQGSQRWSQRQAVTGGATNGLNKKHEMRPGGQGSLAAKMVMTSSEFTKKTGFKII